ncbi:MULTISPECIES: carbohydrate ABC transporter permease [unclassified Microbacterium]|uniref:carbohydrate ABC transporter permease n=1 Tax=unclassified Microbacterium TaxID=2609290 RepID=UPI0036501E82
MRADRRLAYALIAPAVIVLLAILAYPLGRLLVLSFQKFDSRSLFTGEAPFVGLGNYAKVLADGAFWLVLGRTALITATTVVAVMVGGFLLAQLLRKTSGWARMTLMIGLVLVWGMPMVSAAIIWQWLFQPQYGVMNWVLTRLGVFGDLSAHNWFGNATEALAIIIVMVAWKGLPFVAITLYAAMTQIPEELYEAASLDGAGPGRIASAITLPMLRPILVVLTTLQVIWSVNSFTPFWVLTQGGPAGGTTTLSIYAFVRALTANDYGTGAAISIITVILLSVLSAAYVRRLAAQGELA